MYFGNSKFQLSLTTCIIHPIVAHKYSRQEKWFYGEKYFHYKQDWIHQNIFKRFIHSYIHSWADKKEFLGKFACHGKIEHWNL